MKGTIIIVNPDIHAVKSVCGMKKKYNARSSKFTPSLI